MCEHFERQLHQRAHAACTGVARAFYCAKVFGCAALRREPGVDQRIAEFVRQRIREQTRLAMKRIARQSGELVHPVTQRHHEGGKLNPACGKSGIVLEGGDILPFVQRDRADGAPPKSHLCDHVESPQVQSLDLVVVAFRLDARWRLRP